MDAAIPVRGEDPQVVQFAGGGIVAGIPHPELYPRYGFAGRFVGLQNLDGGGLVIFKIEVGVPVGVEGDKLLLTVQQVGAGYGLLYHLVDHG